MDQLSTLDWLKEQNTVLSAEAGMAKADLKRLRSKLRFTNFVLMFFVAAFFVFIAMAAVYRARLDTVKANCERSGVSFDTLDTAWPRGWPG